MEEEKAMAHRDASMAPGLMAPGEDGEDEGRTSGQAQARLVTHVLRPPARKEEKAGGRRGRGRDPGRERGRDVEKK